jgi:hypothetical protein
MGPVEVKDNSTTQGIHLTTLKHGMPGMTSAFGESIAEAAAVCLEDQKHASGVKMHVDGKYSTAFCVHWDVTTDQIRSCWADPNVTTEHGAYGIAFLLVSNLTGLTVVERSRRGTGFDFWLGSEGNGDLLFQQKTRLEVSGIRRGTKSDIISRIREKLNQTQRSQGAFPALVVVVEFGHPRSRVDGR